MAYGSGFLAMIQKWRELGVIAGGGRVHELGSQMVNAGTRHEDVAAFIKTFNPGFTDDRLDQYPVGPYYSYAADLWTMAGFEYLSYDITEAPGSKVFDLNFHSVPPDDFGTAEIVTNLGTTEHLINQYNAFEVVHNLLKVGGVSIHEVPITGMLNHGFFSYHPKFFFSLIVNNRYKLRWAEYSAPSRHSDLGVGNTVYEGDYLSQSSRVVGASQWKETALPSGVIILVIEKRSDAPFVPPVDFAHGYFGEITGFDLSQIVDVEDLPHSAWADAYRRGVTPSQSSAPGARRPNNAGGSS